MKCQLTPRAQPRRAFLEELVIAEEDERGIPRRIAHEKLGLLYKVARGISEGAQGAVYSYELENEPKQRRIPDKIALKVYKSQKEAVKELEVIHHLDRYGYRCEAAIVAASPIGSISSDKDAAVNAYEMKGLVMEHMEGNLMCFENKCLLHEALQIIREIANACACLCEQGLYYCDLKPENVLYNCNRDGTYAIRLGDLGGLSRTYASREDYEKSIPKDGVYTFSNPKGNKARESCVVFGLATLFVAFLDKESSVHDEYFYKRARPFTMREFYAALSKALKPTLYRIDQDKATLVGSIQALYESKDVREFLDVISALDRRVSGRSYANFASTLPPSTSCDSREKYYTARSEIFDGANYYTARSR